MLEVGSRLGECREVALWVVKMVRAGLDRMVASDRSVPVVVGSRCGADWVGIGCGSECRCGSDWKGRGGVVRVAGYGMGSRFGVRGHGLSVGLGRSARVCRMGEVGKGVDRVVVLGRAAEGGRSGKGRRDVGSRDGSVRCGWSSRGRISTPANGRLLL